MNDGKLAKLKLALIVAGLDETITLSLSLPLFGYLNKISESRVPSDGEIQSHKPSIFFLLKKKASLSEESEKTRDVTREQREGSPATRVVAPRSVSHPDRERERVSGFLGTGRDVFGWTYVQVSQ